MPEKVRRRNAKLMDLAAVLMWFSLFAYVPILPAYAASLGADAAVIGIIGGVYGILQVLLRIALGFWSDRMGRDRLLLLCGFSLMIISALMFLCTNSIPWIIAARTVAGGASAWWVIVSASYAKYQSPDEQVKGQGVIAFAANAGKVLAAVSCAVAAQAFGYKATFVIALGAAAASVLTVCLLKDPQAERVERAPLSEQLKILRRKDFLAFCFLGFVSQMMSFGIATTFTLVAAEDLGADSMQLGLIQVVYFAVVSVTSLFAATKMYRRLGGIWSLVLSFALGALSCVPDFYASIPSIYLMQILSGCCYGVTLAVLAGFVVQCVTPDQRGGATGIFQSLYAIGILLGPVIAGAVVEAVSFNAAYWLFFALGAGCAVLCPILIPKRYAGMT